MLGKVVYSPQPIRGGYGRGGPSRNNVYGGGSTGGYGNTSGAHTAQAPVVKAEYELAEDYSSVVRLARERMHITTAVLAELVSEKESFIDRIEKGGARPGDELAHKLEKALGIKILEPANSVQSAVNSNMAARKYEPSGRTLGDVIEIERKKKKD